MSIKDKRENLTLKQKRIISIIIFALLLLFCAYVGWVVGRPMIQFVENPEKFQAWVDNKGFFGKIAFMFMVIFQVIIAFVPGEPLEIGAGYAFGAIEGTLLCVLGITLGSIVTFWLVRRLGMRFVEIFFPPVYGRFDSWYSGWIDPDVYLLFDFRKKKLSET